MIITVTMNPAMDKTIDIKQLMQGGLNRALHVESDVGGKGINVSKTIAALGGKSVATGFVAGNIGKQIQRALADMSIEHDFIPVAGETRINIKIVEESGMVTEINEPGPQIGEKDSRALLRKLEDYAGPDTLFVLAGSLPGGVDKDIYRQIILLVHKKGAKVLLDADGEAFARAVEAGPDIVKPNREELLAYAQGGGHSHLYQDVEHDTTENPAENTEEFIEERIEECTEKAGNDLLEKGIEMVVVSKGQEGAIFRKKDCRIQCPGLQVKAHSTVGAGDAMVAALAYGWDNHFSFEETVKLCMAASAGAVMTVGTKPPSGEVVDWLMNQVVLGEV